MALLSINSNVASLKIQAGLARSTGDVLKTTERLSSGLRINSASDDAAGLSVASQLLTDTRIYTQAIRNGNDGISALAIAEGGCHELTNILMRMRELAIQSSNGTFNLTQRRALDSEAKALSDEYDRITQSTEFNGMQLLDGSRSSLSLQLGYGTEGVLEASIGDNLSRTVGQGTFAGATTVLSAGPSTKFVNAADFNGDGRLDFVSADGARNLVIGLQQADGTFSTAISYTLNNGGSSVIAKDIDGDGKVDLAVGEAGAGAQIYWGDGDGHFSTSTLIGGFNASLGLIVEDLNGDGKQDVGGRSAFTISTVMNGTGRTFAAPTALPGSSGNSVRAADMNNDGQIDLLSGGGGGALKIWTNLGGGSFSSAAVTTGLESMNVYHIDIGDLNHDGLADVLASNSVYLGRGDGSFTLQPSPGSFGAPGFSPGYLNDLNGDGILDKIASSGTALYAALGKGDGTFAAESSFSADTFNISSQVSADFNNDGVVEILAGNVNALLMFSQNKISTTSIPRLNLLTAQSSLDSLSIIDAAMSRVSGEIGSIGALQSRINVSLNNLTAARENAHAAASRITDADIAIESANNVKASILQQVASAVLAQANQEPQLAVKLLS